MLQVNRVLPFETAFVRMPLGKREESGLSLNRLLDPVLHMFPVSDDNLVNTL